MKILINALILSVLFLSCKKSGSDSSSAQNVPFSFVSLKVNDVPNSTLTATNINYTPVLKLSFNAPVDRSTVSYGLLFNQSGGGNVPYKVTYTNNDSVLTVQPNNPLQPLTRYLLNISTGLQSLQHTPLQLPQTVVLITRMDSTDKFPRITDSALLDLVQQQTLKYFWDFGHPVSGLARERNTSGDVVTTGGSGFGIMAIIAGINRGFIPRAQGLARMQTIVGFLKNTAQKFHGAFPHWLNGNTGVVFPFSTKDNGADLVETSFLMEGLLCARQYFNGTAAAEATLRSDINAIWDGIEWSWFRQNNQNVLYWHWSPNYNWDLNFQIRGWNEALITYVLAASSNTFAIPKVVYDQGWAQNGAIRNNATYYGYVLPLGPPVGGPLFFEHYSFQGINPFGLSDQYASYQQQTINHTKINYEYCKADPKGYGYSAVNWGLTASDIPGGYTASSPTNDVGVIAPTAALSSFPYTPNESMNALKFFYYTLGDRLWGPYGFYDAFSLKDQWFANSYLAIDQGPVVVMIENYRTGLLWNLFMSCPEVKTGMRNLGFTSPFL